MQTGVHMKSPSNIKRRGICIWKWTLSMPALVRNWKTSAVFTFPDFVELVGSASVCAFTCCWLLRIYSWKWNTENPKLLFAAVKHNQHSYFQERISLAVLLRQMLMMGVIHSLTFWNPSSPFQLSHHRSPAQENFHSVKGKAFPNICVAFHLLRKDFGLNCQLMSPLGTWCLMWNECAVPL